MPEYLFNQECQLSDVAYFVSDKIEADEVTVKTYISTENMLPNRRGVEVADKLSSAKRFNHFRAGDTLFSNIRTYFKKIWLSEFDGGASPDVLIFRTSNAEVLDPNYLYFLLSSDKFINYTVLTARGAKMPRGDKAAIMQYKFFLPELEIQQAISLALLSMNKKIELNRQTNQTLEKIAQAIFKSWFVDFEPTHAKIIAQDMGADTATQEFAAQAIICGALTLEQLANIEHNLATTLQEAINAKLSHNSPTPINAEQLATTAALFPNALVESELGEIPEGWRYLEASKVADIAIGKTPPRKEAHWFSKDNSDVRWVSIRDLGDSGLYVLNTSERLTEEAVSRFNVRRIPHNTVLLSFKMTVGRVAITNGEMLSNEAIAHFKLIEREHLSTEYLYLYLKCFNYDSLGSTSSIVTALNSKIIRQIPVLVPSAEISAAFKESIEPIFQGIKSLLLETQNLIKLRDTLLPKLLSGELDVSELADNLETEA